MNIKKWIKTKRVGVLYGGISAEREISLKTGKAVIKALKELNCNVTGIDAGRDVASKIKKSKIDFAFISLHGPYGEDGKIQGLLEIMGIPYSGSGVLSSALAMDKVYSKRIFDSQHLPTPRWWLVTKDDLSIYRFESSLPVVVKPSTQGSTIGISIVKIKSSLDKAIRHAFTFDSNVLIEKYIEGTEITVGILGDRALPVVEIVPDGGFYDFESKYKPGKSSHIIPPRLPEAVIRRSQKMALEAFRALGCRGFSRVDLIVDKKNKPWILEINTIPGMTETSLLPDAARAEGMSFNNLVLKIIESSLR